MPAAIVLPSLSRIIVQLNTYLIMSHEMWPTAAFSSQIHENEISVSVSRLNTSASVILMCKDYRMVVVEGASSHRQPVPVETLATASDR